MKILFITVLFLTYVNSYVGNQIITLKLNWKYQFQFAGYIMAKEMGYYDDVGLDVRIYEFQNENNFIELIKRGDIEFAVGRPSLMIDRYKGEDVVALGAIFQHSPMVLLTLERDDINSIDDLRNKRIMVTADATISSSLIAMFFSNGIKLSSLNIQKHSFNIDDLIKRRTDAMASYISNEPVLLKNRGIEYKIFNPKDFGFDFYEDILYTSSLYIKNNPRVVKDFYEATIKGWKYAFNNIKKSAITIYNSYNTQNKSLNCLIEEGHALRKYALDNDINKIGYLDKVRLSKMNDVYKIIGLVDSDIDLDNFVYEHNNNDMIELKFNNNQLYLYILYFSILFAIIFLLVIYLIVRKRWLIPNSTLNDVINRQTEKLKEESLTDPLTEVKNRKAYNEKLDELFNMYRRYKNSFCIISIDIDDFKLINDTYGHKFGDDILIKFCRLAEGHIRVNDYFFRVGGEEFMVLLPNTEIDNGLKVCEKLLFCTKNLKIDNSSVTISMGLVEVQEDDTPETIYSRVDTLLYASKRNGKNQISTK